LSEPPSEEIYEMLDGLCPFEIVRTGETVLWGWHRGPSVCCYHEECSWSVAESAV
jgi:hypothetical protein